MNIVARPAPVGLLTIGLLTILLVVAIGWLSSSQTAGAQTNSFIALMAIDADPTGNTATSLGEIDSCVSATVGSEIEVDLVVDQIPEDRLMASFQIEIGYDPAILEAVAVDNDQLLGAEGSYEPFEALTDPLPDSDGALTVSSLDLASDALTFANMENGPGVISRVTFRAIAEGTSVVRPNLDPGFVYPAILDTDSEVVSVRKIAPAAIVVGGDCEADSAPPPTEYPNLEDFPDTTGPIAEDDPGSSDTAIIVVAAVLGVVGVAAAAGGWILYRKRSQGTNGSGSPP